MSSLPETSTRALRISVVVPSYRRPEHLARCLAGLAEQTRSPDEIIVVARLDDTETRAVAQSARAVAVRLADVMAPGVVAAMRVGATAAGGEVVAFIDDDAVPRRDWVERLGGHFARAQVGAVGGRDLIPDEMYPETSDVGRITRWGRLVGNQHLGVGPVRSVDVLKGVNLAVRREALALPAMLRGRGAEVHWELSVCAWARARGWDVVFDPVLQVDHFPAPRPAGDDRAGHPDDVRDASYNLVLALATFFPQLIARRAAYGLLIGDRMTPGLVRTAVALARGERDVVSRTRPALRGQCAALATYARGGRQRMTPIASPAHREASAPPPTAAAAARDRLRALARDRRVRWMMARTPPVRGIVLSGPGRGLRMRAPRGHLFYLTGMSEPLVQAVLRDRLPRGGVMVDVGSFVGFEALLAARLVGPEGEVHAFEPHPASAQQLRRNVVLNRLENVHVRCACVGAAPGFGSVVGAGLTARVVPGGSTPVVALDDLGLQRVDLVKIDVEGAEVEVLRGMEMTLREQRPVVICEIHGATRGPCEELLRAAGYRCEWLDDGGMPHIAAYPAPAGQAGRAVSPPAPART